MCFPTCLPGDLVKYRCLANYLKLRAFKQQPLYYTISRFCGSEMKQNSASKGDCFVGVDKHHLGILNWSRKSKTVIHMSHLGKDDRKVGLSWDCPPELLHVAFPALRSQGHGLNGSSGLPEMVWRFPGRCCRPYDVTSEVLEHHSATCYWLNKSLRPA